MANNKAPRGKEFRAALDEVEAIAIEMRSAILANDRPKYWKLHARLGVLVAPILESTDMPEEF